MGGKAVLSVQDFLRILTPQPPTVAAPAADGEATEAARAAAAKARRD